MKVSFFHYDRDDRGNLGILSLTVALFLVSVIFPLRTAFAQSFGSFSSDPMAAPGDSADAAKDFGDGGAPSDNLNRPPPDEAPAAPAIGYSADPSASPDTSAGDADSSPPSSDADSSGAPMPSVPDATVRSHANWTRSDDRETSDSDDTSNATLEVPQVLDKNATAGNDSDDQNASAGNGADPNQAASNGSDSGEGDTLGGIDQYQDQENPVQFGPPVVGVYIVPAPIVVQPVRTAPYGYGAVPMTRASGSLIGRPITPGVTFGPRINSMTGAFPPTSPMLTPSRGSGAIPGGWWTRSR